MKKAVLYDIKNGVLRMWPRFVLAGALLLLLAMPQARQACGLARAGLYGAPSFGNYLAVWMKGADAAFLHVKGATRVGLPAEWLMLHFNYILLMAGYAHTDLKKNGAQMMLRQGGRCGWWGGKCIWAAAATAAYYLVFYAVLAGAAAATGSLNLMPRSGIWVSDLDIPAKRQFFLAAFVVLPAGSLMAGLAQVLLELLASPAVALAAACGYQFAVLYWDSPLLAGNYAMLSRRYAGTGGAAVLEAGACMLFCLCIYAAGRYYIKKVEF